MSFWGYKEDHIELLRDQLEKDDGKMNYRIQKKFSYGRLSRNFADCLDRALTAEGGLFIIFGCDLGLLSLLQAEPELYLNRVNVLYNWIYEAIEFLTAYSQLDQAFSVCVSLKGILAKETFDSLKNAGAYWGTTFKIPRDIFPTSTQSNIRFKGAGAFLLGKAGAIPWKINLQLPSAAVYTRNNEDVQIDQDQLPGLILGRVENKDSNRNMEYGGMVSLNNASPISADYNDPKTFWKIDVCKPLSEEELFSNIEDIVLEFSLTGKLFYEQA